MSAPPINQSPVPTDKHSVVFDELFRGDEESNDVSAVDVVVVYAIYEDKDPMSLFSQPLPDPLPDSGPEKSTGAAKNKHEIFQHESGNKPKKEERGTPAQKWCNWLKDKEMLRSALPAIGILSCGLKMARNTSVDFHAVSRRIGDEVVRWRAQRKRPIIWIAHGYGTRVVRHLSEPNSSARGLVSATAAILLFAAPTDASKACLLREWTCNKLNIPLDSKNAPFENEATPSSINLVELVTVSKEYDMTLLSVVDGERSGASKVQDEVDQKNVSTKPGDTKQKEKANLSRDREHTSGTQSIQTQAQVDRFIDHIPVKKGDFGDTAKFRGREDRTFVHICNKLQNAAKTYQILSAARRGTQGDMERLIKKGINVQLSNNRGESALHIACESKDPSIVQYLVGIRQIDLRQPDRNGMTALHIAAQRLDKSGPEVVRMLLEAGANWTVRDDNHHTPLDLARGMAAHDTESQPVDENKEKIIDLLNNPPSVRRVFANRGMVVAERRDELKKACANVQMTVRELNFAPGRDMVHLPKYATVEEVIYGQRDINELMKEWFQKHQPDEEAKNQMAWVHDLFVQLKIKEWPWPQGFKDYGRPQSFSMAYAYKSAYFHQRCAYPHYYKFPNLGEKNNAYAFMMPYVAFGNSQNQGKAEKVMDNLMARSSPGHRLSFARLPPYMLELRVFKFFKDIFDTDIDELPAKHFESFRNRLADAGLWPRMSLQDIYEDEEGLISTANMGFWNYLFYTHPVSREDLPLHPRRTLDQSYYYMLPDTSYRDKSQVYSRWSIEQRVSDQQHRQRGSHLQDILFGVVDSGDDLSDFEDRCSLSENSSRRSGVDILMVDQLWLWLIPGKKEGDKSSPDTLITSFPSSDEPRSPLEPLDERIIKDPNRSECVSTRELVKSILNGCSQKLRVSQEESLNAMEAFENAIGNAEEKEAQLFQVFNILSGLLSDLDDKDRLYPQLQKRYLRYLDILKEVQLLTEVKDILDEIKMIEKVVESQRQVLCEYEKDDEPRDGLGVRPQLIPPLLRVQEGFKNMKDRAQAVEKSIERLLDLKQKQANTWEARIAREGAAETAKQGSNLFWFTIVTIIFLPLSFMASFLALDVDQFPQDPESRETSWPLARVCALICKQNPVSPFC
ncbi:uncharacterized protein FMAN_11080 [Fusarium mangiferae]|uniref:Uncharacterized protein n=1 Tax=Fusarium mangiferae TaxID=192010 RepID=A0A1L7TNB7_FUSMA|nr:uncharacterized protein FMAN_11080 [Fusarium mangiferae]CVK96751.1 uncharacterized protein FMAN_11080 [Fusarium mangiferae]